VLAAAIHRIRPHFTELAAHLVCLFVSCIMLTPVLGNAFGCHLLRAIFDLVTQMIAAENPIKVQLTENTFNGLVFLLERVIHIASLEYGIALDLNTFLHVKHASWRVAKL
jgi:hypothetical protein